MDPWGSERDNFHVAMLLAQTANLNLKKGRAPISPTQFMLGRNTSTKDEAKRISALRASIHESRKVH